MSFLFWLTTISIDSIVPECGADTVANARTEAAILTDDIVYTVNTGSKSFASSADGLALLAAARLHWLMRRPF